MKLTSLALAGVIAAAALGANASLAQPAPGPAAAGGQWRAPDPAQMAERHAERLRTLLQLRPDQEPALRALVAALKPDADRMAERQAYRAERNKLTAPQRLDRIQARMSEHQAAFARKADAIKRFYAQLTPAQQRAFDAMPMMHGRHGHGMHEGGSGRPGHGQPPPPVG